LSFTEHTTTKCTICNRKYFTIFSKITLQFQKGTIWHSFLVWRDFHAQMGSNKNCCVSGGRWANLFNGGKAVMPGRRLI
jgi:hypothetical protein